MKKKNGKVIKYRRPLRINISMIVFGIILLYLMFNIFFYLTKKHISVYEVEQGTIVTNHTYRGLIIRQEEIVNSAGEGYVTYYLQDATKAGIKTPVYSLDASGDISNSIEEDVQKKGSDRFTKENYLELEHTVQSYTGSYDNQNFYGVYSFRDQMDAKMMELQNVNALDALGDQTTSSFQIYNAVKPGVVVYYTDGYEQAQVDTLTEEMFQEKKYKKVNLKDQEQVGNNVPVYKLITDENWNVIFQISEKLADSMKDDNTVEVLFKDDGNKIWAYYDILTIGGKPYLNLKLRTSMIRFANQRFIDVELLLDDASGLKIPNTAITSKEFITIPKEYFMQGNDSEDYGLVISSAEGEDSFVTPEIYYEKDDLYYVDAAEVPKGSLIRKPDSGETYTVNKTAKLKGVYNIDKGYAIFKQIDVLYKNEEYSILKKGTSYGISLYDHIALEGDAVKEGDLVH